MSDNRRLHPILLKIREIYPDQANRFVYIRINPKHQSAVFIAAISVCCVILSVPYDGVSFIHFPYVLRPFLQRKF